MEAIIKIYGVQSRKDMIEKTANKLSVSEENIFYDDRPNGGDPLYTAKKAYLSDYGNATHLICLQDDIEVCDNFKEICDEIIKAHPDKVVSLFPFDYLKQTSELDNLLSPYIKTFTVSGQGIIMPVEYIKPCFDYIKKTFNDDIDDDRGIQRWARDHNIEIITTIPATLQHIGDNSALGNRPVRRTDYYQENPIADWSNKEVCRNLTNITKFAPKRKFIMKK